jgi:hypothetical protein
MPRCLVACEYSGRVRDAFLAKGWEAWSCDLLPTESPGPHAAIARPMEGAQQDLRRHR